MVSLKGNLRSKHLQVMIKKRILGKGMYVESTYFSTITTLIICYALFCYSSYMIRWVKIKFSSGILHFIIVLAEYRKLENCHNLLMVKDIFDL